MKQRFKSISFCLLMAPVWVLCSCYSYKPFLDSKQLSTMELTDTLRVGQKYKVITKTGQEVKIVPEQVASEQLAGRASVYTQGKNYHYKELVISKDQIEVVKNRKFSPGITALTVGLSVGLLVLIGSTYTLDLGGFKI